ncbi:MAG: endonuclease III [Thermovirga sp.]
MKPLSLPDPVIVRSCLDDLEALWHNGAMGHPPGTDDPLDGLILTLLSQNTNDRNRDRAFGLLKARFPSWAATAKADPSDIADAIRSGGIANVKAARILVILDRVFSEFQSYSLKALKGRSTESVKVFLQSIPGIGPKTIACVLLFDLGRPAFPVDTHVARVSRRLGWVGPKTTPEEIEGVLKAVVEEDRYLGGHLNIITHGRHICVARRPRCKECPISDRCDHYKEGMSSCSVPVSS